MPRTYLICPGLFILLKNEVFGRFSVKLPAKVPEIKLGAFGEIKIIPAAAIPLYRRTKHSTRRNPK